MFYDSNYDKYFTPEIKGWYVQYKTESGDSGAILLPREPLDKWDALEMLKSMNSDEIWNIEYYIEIK